MLSSLNRLSTITLYSLPNISTPSSSKDQELTSTNNVKSVSSNAVKVVDTTGDSEYGYQPVASSAPTQVLSAISATKGYTQFMPTRPGFSSGALAEAVSNPGLEVFSSGMSSNQVAAAARQSMDSNYATMTASGQPFDINSQNGKDWYTLMGSLDRRALSAVASNSGNLFSTQEQNIAQSIMSQQQGLATGLYSGPTSEASNFVDPFQGESASARAKFGVQWLDQVSNDEKNTVGWAFGRASEQISYEKNVPQGTNVDNLDSKNPLAKLIKNAMGTISSSRYYYGDVTTSSELLNQPWFKGFEGNLDEALFQTNKMYT